MNQYNFEALFNLDSMTPEGEALNVHTEALQALLKVVQEQGEQIKALRHDLYSIVPAMEYIEMLAKDPEEKADMLSYYVINNPDWEHDRNNYQPDKIINEMAAGAKDEQARDCLQTLYQDYGAGCLVRLYKKWKGIDPDRNLIHNLMMDTETDTQKG